VGRCPVGCVVLTAGLLQFVDVGLRPQEAAAAPDRPVRRAAEVPVHASSGPPRLVPAVAGGDFREQDPGPVPSIPGGPSKPPAAGRSSSSGPVSAVEMAEARVVRREEKADFFVTRDRRQVARLYAEPKNVQKAFPVILLRVRE